MALVESLTGLFFLTVISSSAAQHESLLHNCSSETQVLERLSADLKESAECGENLLSALSEQETAALLLSIRDVTDALSKHQLKGCHGAEPNDCPGAEVPDNGGLACVTVAKRRYCKPLCNHGYDFGFLRRSRLYDECSNQTGYKWQSQYVGGNKLAVCNKEAIPISGAKSAYFPENQDCLTTKSSSQLQAGITDGFMTELRDQGVQGEPQHGCLVCGRSFVA